MSLPETCIFCKIAAGQVASKVVYQDEQVMAFRDLNPQAPVHVLVIPKKHIESVFVLKDEDNSVLAQIHRCIQKVATAEKIADSGFRVIANTGKDGGQTVSHLHYHVLGGRAMSWPPG